TTEALKSAGGLPPAAEFKLRRYHEAGGETGQEIRLELAQPARETAYPGRVHHCWNEWGESDRIGGRKDF
ncbi:unnamed protein product, partial [Heterotrigona itama]